MEKMRNYLSFGGGVNSVALHLLMLDEGIDFESVFVHHGTDWPETYQYVAGFQWWLKQNGYKSITILKPNIEGYSNLYDYCYDKQIVPLVMNRWCTAKAKTRVIYKYIKKPCFMNLGFDFDEAHRAKINYKKNVENRFPLIENEIKRDDCFKIIKAHGLSIPRKSGCFICPFQPRFSWKELRYKHPDLFCKAVNIEKRNIARAKQQNKKQYFLTKNMSLLRVVEENQGILFKQNEYPPCLCAF